MHRRFKFRCIVVDSASTSDACDASKCRWCDIAHSFLFPYYACWRVCCSVSLSVCVWVRVCVWFCVCVMEWWRERERERKWENERMRQQRESDMVETDRCCPLLFSILLNRISCTRCFQIMLTTFFLFHIMFVEDVLSCTVCVWMWVCTQCVSDMVEPTGPRYSSHSIWVCKSYTKQ